MGSQSYNASLRTLYFLKRKKCYFMLHCCLSWDPALLRGASRWTRQKFLLPPSGQSLRPVSNCNVFLDFPSFHSFYLLQSKFRFCFTSILLVPDLGCQFVVEVDSSDVGFGAMLSQWPTTDQKLPLCAFFLSCMTPAERNYLNGNFWGQDSINFLPGWPQGVAFYLTHSPSGGRSQVQCSHYSAPPPHFFDDRQVYGLSEGSSMCWARRKVLNPGSSHLLPSLYHRLHAGTSEGRRDDYFFSQRPWRRSWTEESCLRQLFACLLSVRFPAPTFSDSVGYYCLDYLPGVIIV